ncbi:MAG: hypothetical protein ACRCR2_03680 [Fusobacteriaceae bacterium]
MYDLGKKKNLSTKRLEKEMLKFYKDSYYQYREQLNNVKRNSINEVWLRNQIQSVSDNMKKISMKYEDLLTKEMKEIISSIDKTNEACFNRIARKSGLPPDLFTNTFNSINDAVIREMKAGKIYQDGVGLSKRIWKDYKSFDKSIHDVMTEGLRDGLSVYDISKNLAQYINPEDRKPGKYPKSSGRKSVDYNSYRLASTTITHTYQMALDRVNKDNPFMNGIKWVGGHNDNSCETCKKRNGVVYAAKNPEPWNDITAEPLPLDHPNGLCINIPYIEDDYESIGRRLYLWSEGKEDPALDDWFEKNGDKYKSAKDVKDAKDKTKEKEKKQEGLRDDAWINKNFRGMKSELPEDVWLQVKDHILKSPKYLQDFYALGGNKFKYGGTDGDNAYYHPGLKHVVMDFRGEGIRAMNVFFHEYGHFLDHTVLQSRYGTRMTAKYKEIMWDSMMGDYENLLRSSSSSKMWEMKPDVAKRQALTKLNRELLEIKGHHIAGVSDVLGGLTKKELQGRWGHSQAYWDRRDRKLEVVSEAIANLSEAMAIPESKVYMEKYFPDTLKLYEKIIKEIV